MSTTLTQILSIHKEANDLLVKYQLAEKGWTFELGNEQRRMGVCRHSRKIIGFSRRFLHIDPAQITDTLLHEIAHALVGPGHGHDSTWRSMARHLGASDERCYSLPSTEIPPYNYVLYCPNSDCNKKWYRYRIKASVRTAICPVHRETLVIERLR